MLHINGNYNDSKNLNQQMGNCAGGTGTKGKVPSQLNQEQLKKSAHEVNQTAHKEVPHPHKQQTVVHNVEPKSGHQNQHHKEQHKPEEVNIVDSLQIESAKKQILKQVHHDQIKESASALVEKPKSAVTQLKESIHNHQFTFQNSQEQEQAVPEEDVDNFRNNNVRINFEIRAN